MRRAGVVLRPKHIAIVGRLRIAWKFGHYRTGLSRVGRHWTGAVPFMWWSLIVRNRRP